jgi:O-antigen/teichoic acid export membrane protein
MLWLYRETRWSKFGVSGDFRRLFRKYFSLGGSLMVSHVLLSCTTVIPSIFIAKQYGDEILGQFSLAYQAVCLPSSLLGGAIGSVFYQRASECWAQGGSFSDVWKTTAKKLIFIGAPIYSVAVVSLPWVFPVFFGKVWETAGLFAAILSISAFFSFVTSPLDRACLVVGAWLYVPLWHASRALTMLLVVTISGYYKFGMMTFLLMYSAQQIMLYLVDFWAEWKFSQRQ